MNDKVTCLTKPGKPEKNLLKPINKFSEAQLVLLLRNNDRQAFSYLYNNYAPALYNIICRMVEDVTLGEDLLQDVFVKIWLNFNSYDKTRGRLFTWMVNITRHLVLDTMRSRGYQNQKKILSDENTLTNLMQFSSNKNRCDSFGLHKQLNNLKPCQKMIIDMAYFDGYTQDEISKEIGIPLGTVKTRMRSAIISLRKILQLP